MRLTDVHVLHALRSRASSARRLADGDNVAAAEKPLSLDLLVSVQALAALLLGTSSMSGFESSLGHSRVESLEVAAAIAGILIAVGIVITSGWAWLAAMIWVCGVMGLQLILYASGGSPAYVVMFLCVVEVACLHQAALRRHLLPNSSKRL